MTLTSALNDMLPEDRAVFGYGKVRNAAFQAVQNLWRRRKAQGMTQLQLGQKVGIDPARVSKYLSGPGNWTLRTIGAFAEALDGEIEITIHAMEDPLPVPKNYAAYSCCNDQPVKVAAPLTNITAHVSQVPELEVVSSS